MIFSFLKRNKFPQAHIVHMSDVKISASDSMPMAIVSGVNHFLGIHLARALINQRIYVIGIPYVLNNHLSLPEDLKSNPNFLLIAPHQFPQLHDLINYHLIKSLKYIFLTDLYAASFSSHYLSSIQLTKLFKHQLNLLPEDTSHSGKIGFISPYFNSHLKAASFPYNQLHLPQLFQQINSVSDHHLNFRTILLADCYGAYYDLVSQDIFSQIFSGLKLGLHQINLTYSPHDKIFPLYIQDAVDGIIKVTLSLKTNHRQYFLSGSQSYAVVDLINLINRNLSNGSKFNFVKQISINKDYPNSQQITETYKQINWQPKINLITGLEAMRSWLNISKIKTFSVLQPWDNLPYHYLKTYQKFTYASSDSSVQLSPLKRFYNLLNILQSKINQKLTWIVKLIFPQQFVQLIKQLINYLSFGPKVLLLWRPALITILLVAVIGLPIYFGYTIVQSGFLLKSSFQNFKQGKFNPATQQAEYAQSKFNQLEHALGYAKFIEQIPLLKPYYRRGQQQLALGQLTSQTLQETSYSLLLLQETIRSTLDSGIKYDPRLPLSQAQLHLNKNQVLMSQLQASLPDQLPFFTQKIITDLDYQSLKQKSPILRQHLSQIIKSLDYYPYLAGYHQPQTYLIIFQNNRELRPTGGFIGSLALLTMDQGKLDQWQIYDVYDADGQLMGYVQPPEAIINYLGEASWYLRDANWDPDFPSTSKKLQWFVNKELKRQIAGVIAVDVNFIQDLVTALNGIYLPDQQLTITADNFYQYMQNKSETDFFAGSHQKGDYLSLIADAVLYKFKHDSQLDWLAIANTIKNNLQSKHILVYFDHPPTQQLVTQLGWSGSLTLNSVSDSDIGSLLSQAKHYAQNRQVLSAQADVINDYLAIIEANLGVNKVNQYINRQIYHQIDIHQDQPITQTLEIYYQNQSQSDSWLGGDYKNYLRLYLPAGTQIQNIQTGETKQSLNNSTDQGQGPTDLSAVDLDFVEQTQEHGFDVFGFLVVIPAQSQFLVKVNYSLPRIELPNQFTYRQNLIKQAGTQADPYWLTINYPSNYQPTNTNSSNNQLPNSNPTNPQLITDNYQPTTDSTLTLDHSLRYNIQLSQDQQIGVSFIKNKIKSL